MMMIMMMNLEVSGHCCFVKLYGLVSEHGALGLRGEEAGGQC